MHLEPLDCISIGNAAVLKLAWYLLSNYFYEDIIRCKKVFFIYRFWPTVKGDIGLFRSSHWSCSVKKVNACNFIKREARMQYFSCEFWKSFRNTYYISVRLLLLAVFWVFFRDLVKQFHINVRFLDSFKMFSDVFRW